MKISSDQALKVKGFIKEKDLFSLLLSISKYEKSALYSDFNSYLIGQSSSKYQTWIWSLDKLDKEQYLKLKEDLNKHLKKGENKFTCKKELYELLSKDYKTSDYFEMGFLVCKDLIKPDTKKEIFVKINYTDKVSIAEYFRDFEKEVNHKNISQKEALEEAEHLIDDDTYYVLKDSSGDILCMAGYSLDDDLAKISHVFTPIEYRRKGYCQRIIYEITKKLLDDGYKPILYTDLNYAASNKAYKKVGYEDKGFLINFTITI